MRPCTLFCPAHPVQFFSSLFLSQLGELDRANPREKDHADSRLARIAEEAVTIRALLVFQYNAYCKIIQGKCLHIYLFLIFDISFWDFYLIWFVNDVNVGCILGKWPLCWMESLLKAKTQFFCKGVALSWKREVVQTMCICRFAIT